MPNVVEVWHHPAMAAPHVELASSAGARVEVARRASRASRAIGLAVLVASVWSALRAAEAPRPWLAGGVYLASSIALWAVACAAQHRLLLGGHLRAHAPRGNEAAVLADASHHLALAFIVSRAVSGTALAQLGPAIVFAAVGAMTWVLFLTCFRALTRYSDAEEIAGENAAAALSYAGGALALAIIIAHAIDGPFEGWGRSLLSYAGALASCVALYPVRQVVVHLLLGWRPRLRGRELDRAIGQERRLDVAAVEAGTYIAAALLLTGLA
jgi:uncharacterized membrane protein YjfL (UPF0719 family)